MPAVDVLLTGNVGEEGLGNLRGIREVLASRPDIGAVVALEGHNLGRVTHVAVGSRRFRITVKGRAGTHGATSGAQTPSMGCPS